ncbi:hypothetical protein [Lysobacter sp. Root690]|uniref:hypothetical protein n=1 Tax=Lysobacter sp. Root690 TaxID=1736588 RepID=UPI0006F5D484|nr:hypothetical protein [Lysobacter sp. Root690]KRB03395.1 hypothetical protein ASD86_21210 [Lysobacter sp. Root690]
MTGNTLGKAVGQVGRTNKPALQANPPVQPEVAQEKGFWGKLGDWLSQQGQDSKAALNDPVGGVIGAAKDIGNTPTDGWNLLAASTAAGLSTQMDEAAMWASNPADQQAASQLAEQARNNVAVNAASMSVSSPFTMNSAAERGGALLANLNPKRLLGGGAKKMAREGGEALEHAAAKHLDDAPTAHAPDGPPKTPDDPPPATTGGKIAGKKALKCGQKGSYGKLQKFDAESVGMERDHIPPQAALLEQAMRLARRQGIDLGVEQKKALGERIGRHAFTVSVPKEIHGDGLTNSNPNNKHGASDLQKMAREEGRQHRETMRRSDKHHKCLAALQKATGEIGKITNAQYDKFLSKVLDDFKKGKNTTNPWKGIL